MSELDSEWESLSTHMARPFTPTPLACTCARRMRHLWWASMNRAVPLRIFFYLRWVVWSIDSMIRSVLKLQSPSVNCWCVSLDGFTNCPIDHMFHACLTCRWIWVYSYLKVRENTYSDHSDRQHALGHFLMMVSTWEAINILEVQCEHVENARIFESAMVSLSTTWVTGTISLIALTSASALSPIHCLHM